MAEPHVLTQIWPFTCLCCEHAWEGVYEAWHAGGDAVTWRHRGAVSMAPWIDPSCPVCSSLRVKAAPPGCAED